MNDDDKLLQELKTSGKKLTETFDITEDDINKAINDVRRERDHFDKILEILNSFSKLSGTIEKPSLFDGVCIYKIIDIFKNNKFD
jgi:hypothetical protein